MTRPLNAALLALALLPVALVPAVLLSAPAHAFQLPGFSSAQTPQEVHVEAFAAGLRAAIASGDARKVAPLFPAGGPAFAWIGQRWAEMRKGTLDPVAWDVGFERLYGNHERIGGLLTIAAREARGRVVAGRFEVEAVRRGRAWVVGDPLPVTRPDAAITRHDLRVDLRKDGELTAEDVLAIAPSGPARRLFLRLDPNLLVSAASASGQPAAFQQRGDLLFVELPASPQPFELTLAYAGPVAAGQADHVGPDDSLLRADRAWYPRPVGDPAPAVFRLMAMVRPGQRAIAPGAFGTAADLNRDGSWDLRLGHHGARLALPGPALRVHDTRHGLAIEWWFDPRMPMAAIGVLSRKARALPWPALPVIRRVLPCCSTKRTRLSCGLAGSYW
jgi:hypothetical protein